MIDLIYKKNTRSTNYNLVNININVNIIIVWHLFLTKMKLIKLGKWRASFISLISFKKNTQDIHEIFEVVALSHKPWFYAHWFEYTLKFFKLCCEEGR